MNPLPLHWQRLEGAWLWYTPSTKLGIALYKVTCMIITYGVTKEVRVCAWSLRETMVHTIIIKMDVFKRIKYENILVKILNFGIFENGQFCKQWFAYFPFFLLILMMYLDAFEFFYLLNFFKSSLLNFLLSVIPYGIKDFNAEGGYNYNGSTSLEE